MLLSAVSVLVVAQSSSEIPEGLMNNPVPLRIVDALNNSLAAEPEVLKLLAPKLPLRQGLKRHPLPIIKIHPPNIHLNVIFKFPPWPYK